MRRMLEQVREATEGGTVSNSSTRLVVQRYWRKLANPGALRDHGRRPKRVEDFNIQSRWFYRRKRAAAGTLRDDKALAETENVAGRA